MNQIREKGMKDKKLLYSLIAIFLVLGMGIGYFFYSMVTTDDNHVPSETPNNLAQTEQQNDKVLENLQALDKTNSDAKLWLEISDINLSEGMVQGIDNDYYLRRNNQKVDDVNGALFIDYEVSLSGMPVDNLIVYGHNMENHRVFSDLTKYLDKNFFDNAKAIIITDTAGKKYKYEPFLFARVNLDLGVFFPYHEWVNWQEGETALEYYQGMKAHALLNKEITLDKESKLLTLSTCDNALSDARYVLLARLVETK